MRTFLGLGLLYTLSAARPARAAAQGMFVEEGRNALAAGLSFSSDSGVSATSLGGSYSFGGRFDAGLAVHRYRFADYYYYYSAYQVRATGLSLFGNGYLARQDATMPVSLGVTGGVQKVFFSSDVPRLGGESTTGWSLNVGGFAYRRFEITERVSATPQVTLGITHGSFSHVAWGRGRYTASGQSLMARIDGHFAYRDGGNRLWIVTPFLGLGDYPSGSGLAIGGVFP
jgi:hypothetical protein